MESSTCNRNRFVRNRGRTESGFTLVELMIGMLLGLILTGGVITLFIQSRQSFQADENVARMQNQARFALDELARDIRMASFVAEPLVPGGIARHGTLAVATGCGPAGVADWILRFTEEAPATGINTLTGVDNATGPTANAAYSCVDADEVRPGTDLVAVKRVAGDVVPDDERVNGRVYLDSNGTVAMLYNDIAAVTVGGPVQAWEYRPRIYYIRNYSIAPDDGIPTLCRKVLGVGDPVPVETECVAEGIENLQIEYGLDPDRNGAVNHYVADPTLDEMQQVVAARISILARTVQPDRDYTDTRTYQVGNADPYTPNDQFHRRLYAVTVTIHNRRNLQRLMGI
jgi:type IV pilus assembly protein PilW